MKIPQRRQQNCRSSYISARSYSKGHNKEDEGKMKSLETDFKSPGAASCHPCNGLKNRGAALRSKVVKLHSGVTPLGHLHLFGGSG